MGLSRYIGVLSLSFCMLAGINTADAKSKTPIKPFSPYVGQHSILVMTNEGDILHKKNENALCHPASLTKLVTAMMVFKALKEGHLRLDTELNVSQRAQDMPKTELGLEKGMKIKVQDALGALFVVSANDAATVLAEALAGTEEEFARQMTGYVHSLGMTHTVFRNASGLPDPEQVSTAIEMADLMSIAIRDYPEQRHFMQMTELAYNGRIYKGHNKFLKRYPGAEGKTGYTDASGNNLLVSVVPNDGPRVIAVIFGAQGAERASNKLAAYIDESLQTYHMARIPASKSDALALNR